MHRNMHQAIRPPQGVMALLIALMLLLAAALPLRTTAAYGEESTSVDLLEYAGYPDVEQTDWYVVSGDFDYSLKHGIITGYDDGRYGPYDDITRGQVATILWRIADEPSAESAAFDDVNYDEYYGPAIRWARSEGVINGFTGTNDFGPDTPVTREQLAAMLSNYAGRIAGIDVSSDLTALKAIAGADEVSDWAMDAMGWAVDNGILSGDMSSGTAQVNPQGTAQRCMAAKMMSVLHRDILGLGDTPGPDDPQEPSNPENPNDTDTPDNPNEPSVIPGIDSFDYNDEAILVDSDEAAIEQDSYQATVPVDSAGNIKVGDIVVIDPDDPINGMAIEVTSMQHQGDELVLTGIEPEITEVFDSLSLEGEETITADDIILEDGVRLVDDGVSTLASGEVDLGDIVLSVGGDGPIKDAEGHSVSLKGEITFTIEPTLLYDIDIHAFSPSTLLFGIEVESSAEGSLGLGYEGRYKLFSTGGIAKVEMYFVIGADGSISIEYTFPRSSVEWGVRNNKLTVEKTTDESNAGGDISGSLEGKIGYEVVAAVKLFNITAADAGAEGGGAGNWKQENHPSLTCEDLDFWYYFEAFFAKDTKWLQGFKGTWEIFNEDNSPLKLSLHFENGKLVDSCTWDPSAEKPEDPENPSNPDDPSDELTPNPATDFLYEIADWDWGYGVYINGYIGDDPTVVIPEQIEGVDVVALSIDEYYSNFSDLNLSLASKLKSVSLGLLESSIVFGDLDLLESIDITSGTTIVGDFDCYQCENLEIFSCDNASSAGPINFQGKVHYNTLNLVTLYITGTNLVDMTIDAAPNLKNVIIAGAPMASIDLGYCPNLNSLVIVDTLISELDLSQFPNLEYLDCYGNQIDDLSELEAWLQQPGHSGTVSRENPFA
ncbi:S-layer homology domain-containing protein [Collinsella tanakaei]|nr:S-layer homology domain-containing protein [Collinsella tanakaei]